jgi:hypothetical protein
LFLYVVLTWNNNLETFLLVFKPIILQENMIYVVSDVCVPHPPCNFSMVLCNNDYFRYYLQHNHSFNQWIVFKWRLWSVGYRSFIYWTACHLWCMETVIVHDSNISQWQNVPHIHIHSVTTSMGSNCCSHLLISDQHSKYWCYYYYDRKQQFFCYSLHSHYDVIRIAQDNWTVNIKLSAGLWSDLMKW